MEDLWTLVTVSLTGYATAFVVISLIVAIPLIIARMSTKARIEAKPSIEAKQIEEAESIEDVLPFVAIAAAVAYHMHRSRAFRGYGVEERRGWRTSGILERFTLRVPHPRIATKHR